MKLVCQNSGWHTNIIELIHFMSWINYQKSQLIHQNPRLSWIKEMSNDISFLNLLIANKQQFLIVLYHLFVLSPKQKRTTRNFIIVVQFWFDKSNANKRVILIASITLTAQLKSWIWKIQSCYNSKFQGNQLRHVFKIS